MTYRASNCGPRSPRASSRRSRRSTPPPRGSRAELGDAFITLTLETAREQAQAAERAYARGEARPLEGLPLAVKDLFDTEGVRTTYGSRDLRRPRPAARTRWRSRARATAGAIVVGKTLTHEFAWGITSVNPHFAPCRNPYDPERVPGGSSGGSGGGARHRRVPRSRSAPTPAARSGSRPRSAASPASSRPTAGVSTTGVFPLARSLDHAGPMARTPGDVRLLYEALARARAAPERRARGSRVCPDLHVHPLEPGIQRAFDAAVAALDADVVEVGFERAERIYPAYAAIQNAEAAPSRARRAVPRARATSTAPTSRARLETPRARHARRVRRGDRRARGDPRRASRASSRRPTCC